MEEKQLAFSTFLKLLELPEPQKATTLRGFKRGGGFNYWRPLQILAPEVVSGNLALGDLEERIAILAKGHQRKYNDVALTNLLKWVSRRKLSGRSRPQKLVKKFGNAGLKVRLEPEVAFAMDSRNYLMHIWSTNNPTLSEEALSMGLFFFRHHFQKDRPSDCQYLIFDTVKDRIFAEFNILQSAQEMLSYQRGVLDKLWSEIDRDDEGRRQRQRYKDRPSDRPDLQF